MRRKQGFCLSLVTEYPSDIKKDGKVGIVSRKVSDFDFWYADLEIPREASSFRWK